MEESKQETSLYVKFNFKNFENINNIIWLLLFIMELPINLMIRSMCNRIYYKIKEICDEIGLDCFPDENCNYYTRRDAVKRNQLKNIYNQRYPNEEIDLIFPIKLYGEIDNYGDLSPRSKLRKKLKNKQYN